MDAPRFAQPVNPLQPFPEVVGLLGDGENAAQFVAEAVLRGSSAVVCGNPSRVFAGIGTSLARGFVTPLEAGQARHRVRASDALDGFDRAGLVFVSQGHDPCRLAAVVRPRAVVCVVSPESSPQALGPFPFPRRLLRIAFSESGQLAMFPDPLTDADTTATVAAWVRPCGVSAVVFPSAARLLPRAA